MSLATRYNANAYYIFIILKRLAQIAVLKIKYVHVDT